ncbi:MAG: zinc-dependent alcohol dehydrogenase [Christensenellaceae bacterium]|jgi:threonine dehydrogenase-like Zn-dependent dehydrogenase
MNTTVKAAVSYGPGDIRLEEFPMPKPERGAAVIKVDMCGVCGTDKHTYKGETIQNKGTENEISIPFPIIQGHEIVGTIVDIDEQGSKTLDYNGNVLRPGDRVTICPDVVCGKCHYCKYVPTYPWCEHMQFTYGNTRSIHEGASLYGGFAEYLYVDPGARLYKVPEGLSDSLAVLTEPMCVTYALDKTREFYTFAGEGMGFGDTIVIQGMGPIGLMHLIKARMLGAGKIIATDVSDYKLETAKAFGADVVLNSAKTTPEERIDIVLQNTRGLGADVVIECVGKPIVINEGLHMLRKAGTYLEVGMFVDMGPADMNMHVVCAKSLRIVGMYNHSHQHYMHSMDMLLRYQDKFPWEKFVTHQFPLEKTEEAIQKSMQDDCMKVVIAP